MTEAGWLAVRFLAPLDGRVPVGKGEQRGNCALLAVACCRRIAHTHLVSAARYRAAVELVEGFIEGAISQDHIEAARTECRTEPRPGGSWFDSEYAAAHVLMYLPFLCLGDDPAANLLDFFSFIHMAAAGVRSPVNSDSWHAACTKQKRKLSANSYATSSATRFARYHSTRHGARARQ